MSYVKTISFEDWTMELLEKYVDNGKRSKFINDIVVDNLATMKDRKKLILKKFSKLQTEARTLGIEIAVKQPKRNRR